MTRTCLACASDDIVLPVALIPRVGGGEEGEVREGLAEALRQSHLPFL